MYGTTLARVSSKRVGPLVAFLLLVAVAAPAPPVLADEQSPSRADRRAVRKNASSSGEPTEAGKPTEAGIPAEQRAAMTFKDGRLSIHARNRPLELILDEISRVANVPIIMGDDVGTQRVSVDFDDLALGEGLREILQGHDAFFFYGVDEKPPASLKALWVYAKGRGQGVMPVPAEQWASTKDIENNLSNPDPGTRSRALQAIIERKGDQAGDVVSQSLSDPDDQVRVQALYGALSRGVAIPADLLIPLALHDTSSWVRFLALQGLAEDPNGRAVAEQALNDPDPNVQLKAEEILLQLNVTATQGAENE